MPTVVGHFVLHRGQRRVAIPRRIAVSVTHDRHVFADLKTLFTAAGHGADGHGVVGADDGGGCIVLAQQLAGEAVARTLGQVALQNPGGVGAQPCAAQGALVALAPQFGKRVWAWAVEQTNFLVAMGQLPLRGPFEGALVVGVHPRVVKAQLAAAIGHKRHTAVVQQLDAWVLQQSPHDHKPIDRSAVDEVVVAADFVVHRGAEMGGDQQGVAARIEHARNGTQQAGVEGGDEGATAFVHGQDHTHGVGFARLHAARPGVGSITQFGRAQRHPLPRAGGHIAVAVERT